MEAALFLTGIYKTFNVLPPPKKCPSFMASLSPCFANAPLHGEGPRRFVVADKCWFY